MAKYATILLSVIFYLTSASVLVACFFAIGEFAAAILVEPDFESGIAIFLILTLLLFLFIAYHQYRATFLRANASIIWIACIYGLISASTLFAVAEGIWNYKRTVTESKVREMSVFLSISIVFAVSAYSAFCLKPTSLDLTLSRRRYRHIFVVSVSIGALAVYALYRMPKIVPFNAEHVHRSDSPIILPENATDVCYSRDFRGGTISLSFVTDELSFRKWKDKLLGEEYLIDEIVESRDGKSIRSLEVSALSVYIKFDSEAKRANYRSRVRIPQHMIKEF